MNVACGGTLHQHLPDVVRHYGHRSAEAGEFARHMVRISRRSRLEAIVSASLMVMSRHHQGIARLGKRLAGVAFAEDESVEAIGDTTGQLCGLECYGMLRPIRFRAWWKHSSRTPDGSEPRGASSWGMLMFARVEALVRLAQGTCRATRHRGLRAHCLIDDAPGHGGEDDGSADSRTIIMLSWIAIKRIGCGSIKIWPSRDGIEYDAIFAADKFVLDAGKATIT